MAKYICGPWKADRDTGFNRISIIREWDDKVTPANAETFGDYLGAHICAITFNKAMATEKQAEANARLISAAPALLEACMLAVTSMVARPEFRHVQPVIQDAINLATEDE